MSIEIIFGQFCWPSYLTSKLTSMSVNLIMSIYFFLWNLLHSLHVWLFDFWHLFDNLTSFWHFDTSIKLKPPQPAQGYFILKFLEDTSPFSADRHSCFKRSATNGIARLVIIYYFILQTLTNAKVKLMEAGFTPGDPFPTEWKREGWWVVFLDCWDKGEVICVSSEDSLLPNI